MTETGHPPFTQHSDWWSRRPRRSRSDSKVAGVAGGLGHYLGVDPILFRVGFAALTILGGAGILAYALLWLLLPAEGDEVSAGESLIGRGRSSVSPWLAAVLAVVIVVSVTSSAAWGLPFWPVAIIGFIAFHIARKQRRGPFRPGSDWEQRFRSTQQAFTSNQWGGPGQAGSPPWGGQQQQWGGPGQWGGSDQWGGQQSGRGQQQQQGGRGRGHGWGHGFGGWGGCGGSQQQAAPAEAPTAQQYPGFPADDAPSPFDTPAFWDGPTTAGPAAGPAGATGAATADPFRKPGVSFTKGDTGPATTAFPAAGAAHPTGPSSAAGLFGVTEPADATAKAEATGPSETDRTGAVSAYGYPAPRNEPPAWDPLGAAPFAWDLPDIDVSPQATQTLVRQQRAVSPVIARATMGTAVLAVAVQVFGTIAGWWAMGWAAIAGTALTIVALGLLLQAVRGRAITLIGAGIGLSLATLALSLTGLSGNVSAGDRNWAPTTVATVQSEYALGAGNATLDLSGLELAEGQTVTTSLDVNAGQARVIVPEGVNVNVECSANAGNLDCMGTPSDGLNQYIGTAENVPGNTGTINLTVHVGTGDVRVNR